VLEGEANACPSGLNSRSAEVEGAYILLRRLTPLAYSAASPEQAAIQDRIARHAIQITRQAIWCNLQCKVELRRGKPGVLHRTMYMG
jgi:hypothetical protein